MNCQRTFDSFGSARIRGVLALIALLLASTTSSAESPIESILELLELSRDRAETNPAFDIEATVFGYDAYQQVAFLGQNGHFFSCGNATVEVSPGTVIRATGFLRPGALKHAGELRSMEVLSVGELPDAVPVRLEQLKLGDHDCEWVSVNATLVGARISYGQPILICRQGTVRFTVSTSRLLTTDDAVALVGCDVNATGNLACSIGEDGYASGFDLFCAREQIKVTKAASNPLDAGFLIKTVEEVWTSFDDQFRIYGQITWRDDANGFVVETEDGGTWIHNDFAIPLHLGGMVEVFGRRDPETRKLYAHVIREQGLEPVEQPPEMDVRKLYSGTFESTRVRVRGRFRSGEWTEPGLYVLHLVSGKTLFDAWLPANEQQIQSLDLSSASEISVAGVATFHPQTEKMDFRILANSTEDMVVIGRRPLWANRNVIAAACSGLIAVGGLLVWSAFLRARVNEGERSIREITAELHHACDSVRESMIVFDRDDRLTFANRQATATLGIDLETGMSSSDVLRQLEAASANGVQEFSSRWRSVNGHADAVCETELELVGDNDSTKLLEVFSSPMTDEAGRRSNRLWTFLDVTERNQLQQKITHMQKQEAVGRLASGIAHDFNNLLQGIVGNINVAMLDPSSRIREVGEPLQTAIEASERAASLVQRILSFSRKSKLELRSCDVNHILRRMEKLLKPTLGPQIRIEFDLDDQLPPVRADSTQLEQVFLNICVNARDAICGNSDLEHCTNGLISVRTYCEDQHCVVAITDDGPGMSKETQQRVFEPFFTTRQGEGTGLGLAMCEGIVLQHGGRIDLKTALGEGTEFTIFLQPSEADLDPLDVTPVSVQFDGMTGLVVDDEDFVRSSLSAILVSKGVQVETACNGEEALAKLAALRVEACSGNPVDFVLLDWSMPVMGGEETLRALKSLYPDLPTIVCSGYVFDCEQVTRKSGVRPDAFVQKPFHSERITAVLGKVLG